MAITSVFAAVPVTDFDSLLRWYERLVGRPPDMVPKEDEAAWQLTETGWIYLIRDSERAGKALLTVLVEDLEAHVAALAERGIDTRGIDTVPGVVRRTTITDPEGNTLQFGQPLSA